MNDLSNIRPPLPPQAFGDDGGDFGRSRYLLFDGKTGSGYAIGRDKEKLPIGTKAVAIVDEQLKGFTKFVDGKPQSHLLPIWPAPDLKALRQSLGDHDQALWDRDSAGGARDPWRTAHRLPVFLLDETCEGLVFSTSSFGGDTAIRDLRREVQTKRCDPEHVDALPVISLEERLRTYSNKQVGTVPEPWFNVVGWTTHRAVEEMLRTGDFAALLPGRRSTKTRNLGPPHRGARDVKTRP